MKNNILKILLLVASLTGLAGCGDENVFTDTGDITVTPIDPGVTASYTLTAATTSTVLVVGSTTTITATLMDGDLPVASAPVTFYVDNGAFTGNVSNVTVNTNASGTATATLTAPIKVGSGAVDVSYSDKAQTINLKYIAGPASIISLDPAPSRVGVSSDSTLTALVLDQYANPIVNETMQFSFTTNASGAPALPLSGLATTNTNGVASLVYTSGTVAAIDTLKVAPFIGGTPFDETDITVDASATTIDSVTLRTTLSSNSMKVATTQNLTATVLDSALNPMAGLEVSFEIISGSGNVDGARLATAFTDANGVATVLLTAPKLVDTAEITASVAGLSSNNLSLTYYADVPASVTLTPDPPSIGASSDTLLTATVIDQYGNRTPGQEVLFTATNPSGGYYTPVTGIVNTDANGIATIVYTSGTTVGVVDTLNVTVSTGSMPTDSVPVTVSSGAGVPVASKMSVRTSTPSIFSDNSTQATITATLLDSVNAVVPGVTVTFASSGGVISSGLVVTDANGEASITLGAGTDPRNQTIDVTVSSVGVPTATVPVEVIGSTVKINPTQTNLILGGVDTATLTIKAADASGVGVYNTPVSVAIDTGASTGTANLSVFPSAGTTDVNGEWSIDLTGTSAGTVRVVATGLGATDYTDFVIGSLTGSLTIASPVNGSTAPINTPLPFSIDVPAGITGVTLVSSLGTWSGSGTNIRTWTGLTSPTTITDSLNSSSIGTASVNVADTNNPTVSYNLTVRFVDQIVDATSTVSLQASPTTVAPSVGSTLNSSALTANVKNGNGEPIAGAMVTFSMSNPTGTGEYIEPPVAYSDDAGVARATFYSGSQSTDATGLLVKADLWQTADPTLLADSSSLPIIVGGTAASIVLLPSTTLTAIDSDTKYSLPISVSVSDSGGNPVANQQVILKVWPQKYALGYWVCKPEPGLVQDSIITNEDLDRDTILDLGEDLSGDGTLTPANSAAGQIPVSVTTNDTGNATFTLDYGKAFAGFIYDELTASAVVQGTETQATLRFWLGATKTDISACVLGESPLNTSWPYLTVKVDAPALSVGSSTLVNATLTTPNDVPLVGASVSAIFLSKGSDDGVISPTLDLNNTSSTLITDANGKVAFVYATGAQAGLDIIKITYVVAGETITDYAFIEAL